jgi:hypothetical protein
MLPSIALIDKTARANELELLQAAQTLYSQHKTFEQQPGVEELT